MQVNLVLQLFHVILSCGGAGLAITAILLPNWITYHHHSRFWERTNIQTMGILGGGRLAISLRDEHGNKPVDLKQISEGRWTSYTMQSIRNSAWTSAACGSLAAFISIWQALRFGSAKSIPCGCLGLRCALLFIASASMSLTTGLFVYIMWPLLLHRQRLQNARVEVNEELSLDVSVYFASSAIACQLIAFFVDLLLICWYRSRRRQQDYLERREELRRTRKKKAVAVQKKRHNNNSYKNATFKCLINKSRHVQSVSCSSSITSFSNGQSDTAVVVKDMPSRVVNDSAIARSVCLQQQTQHGCHQPPAKYHYRSKSLRRRVPSAPSYSTQTALRSQRAQSESAHDSKLAQHKRRAPVPPAIVSIVSLPLPTASMPTKCSNETTQVSCSNSSLDSSRSSHGTLL